jgi:hypothetical protein
MIKIMSWMVLDRHREVFGKFYFKDSKCPKTRKEKTGCPRVG